MKTATLLAFLMLPFMAHAGAHVTCVEDSAPAGVEKRRMVLRQVGDQELVEEQSFPFELQVFQGRQTLVAEPVTVTSVDVIVNFSSEDGHVSGTLFRDELDQTALQINGENIGFDCH